MPCIFPTIHINEIITSMKRKAKKTIFRNLYAIWKQPRNLDIKFGTSYKITKLIEKLN